MSQRGVFLTFEGGEGSGKSTQIASLTRDLQRAGLPVRVLREPGGTFAGEAIRAILLDPEHAGLEARAELLLYEAARAQLVTHVIEPALAAGDIVLCDRFYDSTTAYQGFGRGLPACDIAVLNALATGGLVPDRTLVLDVEPGIGVRRATAHGADRLESEDIGFHERVRAGFLAIARDEPGRVRVIDAGGSVQEVAAGIRAALRDIPMLRRAFEAAT